jgi:hypothetical protein
VVDREHDRAAVLRLDYLAQAVFESPGHGDSSGCRVQVLWAAAGVRRRCRC